MSQSAVIVRQARTHNLKGVSCRFPHGKLTVVTGVSGSGKSSLAFETVHQEGQRRYLQTFSTYARQHLDRVRRPPVEAIHNIQPTLALRQWNGVSQPRSTVGTITELSDLIGLLFSAIGAMRCVDCGAAVTEETPDTILRALSSATDGERVVLVAPVTWPESRSDAAVLLEGLIREGYGRLWVDDTLWRVEEHETGRLLGLPELPIVVDRLRVQADLESDRRARLRDSLEQGLKLGRGELRVHRPDGGDSLTFYRDRRCNRCGRRHPPLTAGLFSFNTPLGACSRCNGFGRAMGLAVEAIVPDPSLSVAAGAIEPLQSRLGRAHQRAIEQLCRRHDIPTRTAWSRLSRGHRRLLFDGDEVYAGIKAFFSVLEQDRYKTDAGLMLARYRRYTTCERCAGTRLSDDARAVGIRGHHVGGLARLTLEQLGEWFGALGLTDVEVARAGVLPREIGSRLRVLDDVGLGYLSLDRQTRTLSSGEYQRIQLAACIGRGLVDTCYVLDEPTAGLHARDSDRLLTALKELRDLGNTVIVVEHEPEIIQAADYLVELGPGGGELGGELLFEGTLEGLRQSDTPTARTLRAVPDVAKPRRPGRFLSVIGAQTHNLVDLDVRLPVGCITAVTGVSGSGKSTLVFEVLRPAVEERMRGADVPKRLCAELEGPVSFGAVIAMNRSSAGLTSRSTVMSYVGALEPIRKRLADTVAAKERALTPFHFSTNVKGGRCDACEGMGVQIIDMHFMSDVRIVCDACQGLRFKAPVLAVRVAGANIADVYEMTVARALDHFSGDLPVARHLDPLVEVGLGYLKLGQPTQTLSGGELQRLRIAEHLVKRRRDRDDRLTLFLFDEPSLGLHGQDVSRVIALFRRLRRDGHTIVLVEHHLGLIAAADWVIDLGPEGGPGGGRLVVEGTPEEVAACETSHTGRCLRSAGYCLGEGA